MEKIRLQKVLADAGLASRRKAEEWIAAGEVTVNGAVAEIGQKVDPVYDEIVCRGEKVSHAQKKNVYIMLYKPEGCVCTLKDQFDRPTVMDFVQDVHARIFPVGRLDYNTEGLLLLTNDGDFANGITHPKNKVEKTYMAHVKGGEMTSEQLSLLRRGVDLEDGKTLPAKVRVDTIYSNGTALLEIKITEGRNRQVRRMLEAVGHPVLALKRTAIGNVGLGTLPYGKWRHLNPQEIKSLSENTKKL